MRSEKERSLLPNALDALNRKTVNLPKACRIQASAGIGTHTCLGVHPIFPETEKGDEHAASA